MKRLLWVMLTVQALAFAIGAVVLAEPTTPGSVSTFQSVGTITDKIVAALGVGATILVALISMAPQRASLWFALAVDAGALLIAWLLLQASPFAVSVTIGAVALVTFALVTRSLVTSAGADEPDELVEREAPAQDPWTSVPR